MEIITDPPRSALVVTPHPDDAEGGCGATMGKWIKEAGTEVVVLMCTNGDKGTSDREMSSESLAEIREEEQRNASAVLGVKEVVFLSHPDGTLEDSERFRGQVVREIRRHRPELIFCIDPYRSVSHTHRDHRMSGQVALDAAYSYAWSYLHFPTQITEEKLQPHRVKEAFLWGTESPDVFVDVEGYLDLKAESLSRHVSQMRRRNPEERLKRIREGAARQGERAGLAYAEAFRRINFDLGSLAWQFMNS
ncbi:MAG: PIG-L deacetylase family protein [Dehalococcoidia bacterium]